MKVLKVTFVFAMSIFVARGHEAGEEDINARVTALETLLKSQATQIRSLEEKVSAQENTIADLTQKVKARDDDKAEIEGELLECKRISHKNNGMIKRLMKLVKKTCSKTKDRTKDINNGGKEIGVDKTVGIQERFVLDTLETVAFEAVIAGAKHVYNVHIDDKIVFETVSLNVGNGYNAGNGTFTAPMGGIYIFSTSVMMLGSSSIDHGMHIILEKNNVEIAGAYGKYQDAYEHSSVTAAMELQVGDTVAVTVERHDGITFYGDRLTSFTGFLLYAF